jgi:hypothetical protein
LLRLDRRISLKEFWTGPETERDAAIAAVEIAQHCVARGSQWVRGQRRWRTDKRLDEQLIGIHSRPQQVRARPSGLTALSRTAV